MTRWAAGVEYDGRGYAGWQRQPGRDTVQGALEQALSRVAAAPVTTTAAGRTDAGVHALGQVVHFDSAAPRPARAWLLGCNSLLPAAISLRWVQPVATDFDARRSARSRSYRYLILNHPARSALLAGRAAHLPLPLDHAAMHAAAQALLGENDFSSFRAAECQSTTPMRCLSAIRVWRSGEQLVLDVTANAFLHHMVRNIAGALIEVGSGRRPPHWIGELLAARDRRQGGMTAPAGGLYLVAVDYPDCFGLPTPQAPWFPVP